MAETLPRIAAEPYLWPFDGYWTPADTAMLLLGFQEGLVAALGAEAEAKVASDLAGLAASLGIGVVATRRGATAPRSTIAGGRGERPDAVPAAGSRAWQLLPAIAARPLAGVVDHPGDNAFFASPLEQLLRGRGIRNLLLAGLPTEGLLHATQRSANDMGFECLAVADASKGTTPERHDGQLRITTFGNGLFGVVAPAAEVRRALAASSGDGSR